MPDRDIRRTPVNFDLAYSGFSRGSALKLSNTPKIELDAIPFPVFAVPKNLGLLTKSYANKGVSKYYKRSFEYSCAIRLAFGYFNFEYSFSKIVLIIGSRTISVSS
jgi:hypothetical protein